MRSMLYGAVAALPCRPLTLIINGLAELEMSDTKLTVPGMTEPPCRCGVTITVDRKLPGLPESSSVNCLLLAGILSTI